MLEIHHLAVESGHDPDRICTHWPLLGAEKILAVSRSLAALAEFWARPHAHSKTWNHLHPRCIDVAEVNAREETEDLHLRAATIAAEIQQLQLCTGALVEDFQKISEWLAKAAGSTWDAAKTVRRELGLAPAIGEDHRVVVKDWLAADMNALIAALLRQALELIDRIELTPEALATDLAGRRSYGDLLQTAAEMLERAAALANESACFVENLDTRWRKFRAQIATGIALSRDAAGGGKAAF